MTIESDIARAKRQRQRTLFDTIADLYDAVRPDYPDAVVDYLVRSASLIPACAVLEVGCGTGQLTCRLAERGVRLTAIDIGPSMIAAARRRANESRRAGDAGPPGDGGSRGDGGRRGGASVDFCVSSFEDYVAPEGSFRMVVSADAFHWIDPEVRYSKSARLLQPGGWLAVLSLHEDYDEPIGSELRAMWESRSDDGGAWLRQPGPTPAASINASGEFAPAVEARFTTRRSMPAPSVLDLESTRATSLSWEPDARHSFSAELGSRLGNEVVGLTRVATVTMAQVVPPPAG